MEENLIGYLLQALDRETTLEVEQMLASSPEAQRKLMALRRAIAPLEFDRDTIEAPEDLVTRTIGTVAHQLVLTKGRAVGTDATPVADFIQQWARPAPVQSSHVYPVTISEVEDRRAPRRNLIALFGLLFALLALMLPGVLVIRDQQNMLACKDRLRTFHTALIGYSDANQGNFPKVEDGQFGSSFVSTLQKGGFLTPEMSFLCPSNQPNRPQSNGGLPDLTIKPIDYAYSFGYRDSRGQLVGPQRTDDNDLTPILADAPIAAQTRCLGGPTAINHRRGQNVLFISGNVRFSTQADLGIEGDDNIFCNEQQQIRAGVHRLDLMLGRPDERP